jgi:hypothetical protein
MATTVSPRPVATRPLRAVYVQGIPVAAQAGRRRLPVAQQRDGRQPDASHRHAPHRASASYLADQRERDDDGPEDEQRPAADSHKVVPGRRPSKVNRL